MFDYKTIIEKKNRAFKNWNKKNFFFEKFSKITYSKAYELKRFYKNILLITSDLTETVDEVQKLNYENLYYLSQYNFFKKKYFKKNSIKKIFSSFDKIPLKNNSFDLILCNFCFHYISEKKIYLQKLFNLLKKDGLLICNFFGENSLIHLKQSFILTDEKFYGGSFLRFPKNFQMVDFSNLLSQTGFSEVVSEKINFDIYYSDVFSLLDDIKNAGENFSKNVEKKITKNYLRSLETSYKKIVSNEKSKLNLKLEVVSSSCWKK